MSFHRLMLQQRTLCQLRLRWPLMLSLLTCLGIQGLLSVVLLALAMLTDPARPRPAADEAIVRVQDRDVGQTYIAVRPMPSQQHV